MVNEVDLLLNRREVVPYVNTKDIESFCSHCDRRGNRTACSEEDQRRYVHEGQCGWSHRNGTQLDEATQDFLILNGVEYSREKDLGRLDEAIDKLTKD